MSKYSELSDFEINKWVAFERLKSGDIKERYRLSTDDVVDVMKNTWDKNDGDCSVIAVMKYANGGGYNPLGGAHDYCNNWESAGPIIAANKINIAWDEPESEWCAFDSFLFGIGTWDMAKEPEIYYHHANPLRAAMVVYLMMQEQQHDR